MLLIKNMANCESCSVLNASVVICAGKCFKLGCRQCYTLCKDCRQMYCNGCMLQCQNCSKQACPNCDNAECNKCHKKFVPIKYC